MAHRHGSALLIAVILAGVFLCLAVFGTKIVYNSYATTELMSQRERAFWLAEAGLEAGKAKLAENPDWYTDLPSSSVTIGEPGVLPSGSFLIVRVREQNVLSSVGSSGKAKVVLQITFGTAPVSSLTWAEI